MGTRQASSSDDDSNGGERLMPGTSRRRIGIGKHLASLLLAARATSRSSRSRSRNRSRSRSTSRSSSNSRSSRSSRSSNRLFAAMGRQQQQAPRCGRRRVRILTLGEKPRGPVLVSSSWALKLRKKVRLAVSSPCKLASLLRDKYVRFMDSVVSRGIGSAQGLGMANQSLIAGPLLYPHAASFSSRRSQIAPLPASALLDLVSAAYLLPASAAASAASSVSAAAASAIAPPGTFTKHDMADLLGRSLALFPDHAQ